MTAAQAIAAMDELTPNSYGFSQKLAWLRRVEQSVCQALGIIPSCLEEQTDLEAPEPYSELYVRYMQAQIFLEAGEITRYNNAMALYNNALAAMRRDHIRSHVSSHPQLTGF